MKAPQTLAEELYKHFPNLNLKSIKENACCIFSLMYWLGIDTTDIEAIMIVDNLIKSKALDPDCCVYWAECIRQLTGREMESLEKKTITTIAEIKEPTIVRFNRGKTGHWVVVANGQVVFNSLKSSNCVENGQPTEARIIKIKGVK